MAYHTRSGNYDRLYDYLVNYRTPPSNIGVGPSNRIRYELAGVPVLGGFIRANDNTRYMNNYLSKRGLTWADVKYPTRLPGAGSTASAISDTAYAFGMTYALKHMYR